jgi:hypothetical protein
MSSNIYGFGIYGMGGQLTDPGEERFTHMVKTLGVDIKGSPYRDYDIQTILDTINKLPEDSKIILWGSSLGANNCPYVASLTDRQIDGMWGFQASTYGMHHPITKNVKFAHEVYNPNWVQTLGMGAYKWTLAKDNKLTNLYVSVRYDFHPGETLEVENMFLREMRRVIS